MKLVESNVDICHHTILSKMIVDCAPSLVVQLYVPRQALSDIKLYYQRKGTIPMQRGAMPSNQLRIQNMSLKLN